MPETDFAKIELMVLDVDGVLTDGRITLTESGEEVKSFHVKDGAGMKYWQRAGGRMAIISGRGSPAVIRRADELGVSAVRLDAKVKLPVYEELLAELGVSPAETAVIGDDLTDLPLMRSCAFAAAPSDAVEEVRGAAHYVCRAAGGGGCVREVVEHILKKAGKWNEILARYLPVEGEQP
ncbi:MAG: HAD family hydrolase [Phycisphaerae bacterium]